MDYIKKNINEKLNKKPNDFEFIIKLSSIENSSNNPIKVINAKYNYMGEKKIYEDKDILNNGIGNNFIDFINNIFHFNSFHYEKIKDSPEDLIYKCTIKYNNQEDIVLGANNFNYNLDKISKKINPNINQDLILNEKKSNINENNISLTINSNINQNIIYKEKNSNINNDSFSISENSNINQDIISEKSNSINQDINLEDKNLNINQENISIKANSNINKNNISKKTNSQLTMQIISNNMIPLNEHPSEECNINNDIISEKIYSSINQDIISKNSNPEQDFSIINDLKFDNNTNNLYNNPSNEENLNENDKLLEEEIQEINSNRFGIL